jgi:hypothetical protein
VRPIRDACCGMITTCRSSRGPERQVRMFRLWEG